MNSVELIIVIMLAAPLLYIGFDLYLMLQGQPTYSSIIRQWGRKWLPLGIMIAFGMGMLGGHWFWCPACG